jgi:hypothetical protein
MRRWCRDWLTVWEARYVHSLAAIRGLPSEGVQAWVNPEEYRQFVAKQKRAFEDKVDLELGAKKYRGRVAVTVSATGDGLRSDCFPGEPFSNDATFLAGFGTLRPSKSHISSEGSGGPIQVESSFQFILRLSQMCH